LGRLKNKKEKKDRVIQGQGVKDTRGRQVEQVSFAVAARAEDDKGWEISGN
jgi:hypothetical protein